MSKLYAFLPGPFPRRVMMLLALKGIEDVAIQPVNILTGDTHTPEFLEKNPGGDVPLLELSEQRYIPESHAILSYLEDVYPEPGLRGSTEAERRRVDVQCGLINEFYYHCKISSMNLTPYARRYIAQSHDIDMVSGPLWRIRLEEVERAMDGDRFLAGDRLTIADLMLFPLLEYIREVYDMFIPPHLRPLKAWFERVRLYPGMLPLDLPETYVDDLIAVGGYRV